ncbi:MAG: thiamine phosphate synthase [Rhodopseudomonas sp.]|nr:thiamine phosphate synthase [Rhodopseudomonas sp.]
MATRPKNPEPRPQPRLYLMTPPVDDAAVFVAPLAKALAAGDVAAVLLQLADADERSQINRIKALIAPVQAAGAALLIDGSAERDRLVARGGADGAHMLGIDDFNAALGHLKPDWIVGCGGLSTRHDAMAAAEAGADYVMFGEPDAHGERPGLDAVLERVAWWAEVFETPCVAYAAARDEIAPLVAAGADFIAIGGKADDWVWAAPDRIGDTVASCMPHLALPVVVP